MSGNFLNTSTPSMVDRDQGFYQTTSVSSDTTEFEIPQEVYTKLRWMNIVVGTLFAVVSILLLVDCFRTSGGGAAVYTVFWTRDQTGFIPHTNTVNSQVKVVYLSVLFTLLAAIDHLYVIHGYGRQMYEDGLRRGVNYFRWLEYFFSVSLMNVVIAIQCGVLDVMLLFSVGFLTATCMVFGLVCELVPQKHARVICYLGCIPFVAVWAIIYVAFFVSVQFSTGDGVPGFVIAIVVVLLLLEVLFGYNQINPLFARLANHFHFIPIPSIQREFSFILLSLATKLMLVSLTYFGGKGLLVRN
jgi:hypothetical protein